MVAQIRESVRRCVFALFVQVDVTLYKLAVLWKLPKLLLGNSTIGIQFQRTQPSRTEVGQSFCSTHYL